MTEYALVGLTYQEVLEMMDALTRTGAFCERGMADPLKNRVQKQTLLERRKVVGNLVLKISDQTKVRSYDIR